jgi:hypothetical protein
MEAGKAFPSVLPARHSYTSNKSGFPAPLACPPQGKKVNRVLKKIYSFILSNLIRLDKFYQSMFVTFFFLKKRK